MLNNLKNDCQMNQGVVETHHAHQDTQLTQAFFNQLSRVVQSHELRLPRWYIW